MIEIEKDFIPDPVALGRLSKEAEFLGEKTIRDVYYDTEDYQLGKKDYWLRSRNGAFELKTPAARSANTAQYNEIEDEEGIKRALGITADVSLAEHLMQASFIPFCDCLTVRRKYRLGEFAIDVDDATYAGTDFTFKTAEIEVMVEKPEQSADGERKLLEFAQTHGFVPLSGYGKILEYLKQVRPEQFSILNEAGSIY